MHNWKSNEQHGVPSDLWSALSGHRWHATSADALRGIVAHGAIKVCTHFKSFCKSIHAISLFDFGPAAEDPGEYQHWSRWCGEHQADPLLQQHAGKPVGVWLRIRDAYAGPQLINPPTLWQCSIDEWGNTPLGAPLNFSYIIRGVEGAHVGELAIGELDQIIVTSQSMTFKVWNCAPADVVGGVMRHIDGLPADPR